MPNSARPHQMLVDSHTHIYLEQFSQDLEQVIENAEAVDVQHFLMPNIDVSSLEDLHRTADLLKGRAHPMIGLHPCSVDDSFEQQLQRLHDSYRKQPERYCAIGEIGIDLYWDKSTYQNQVAAFEYQIEWAKSVGLPIVIHVRNAFDEVFKVIDQHNDDRLTGVFHCFTGSAEQAKHILDYSGFLLGIGGVLTFKNGKIDRFMGDISLEHIILETDAPYLAPTPHRGQRNEPAYLKLVAEKLAQLHQCDISTVASMTTENCRQLFNLELPEHEKIT